MSTLDIAEEGPLFSDLHRFDNTYASGTRTQRVNGKQIFSEKPLEIASIRSFQTKSKRDLDVKQSPKSLSSLQEISRPGKALGKPSFSYLNPKTADESCINHVLYPGFDFQVQSTFSGGGSNSRIPISEEPVLQSPFKPPEKIKNPRESPLGKQRSLGAQPEKGVLSGLLQSKIKDTVTLDPSKYSGLVGKQKRSSRKPKSILAKTQVEAGPDPESARRGSSKKRVTFTRNVMVYVYDEKSLSHRE